MAEQAGNQNERNILVDLTQEVERLHSSPTRHGVIAHNHVIRLSPHAFRELHRALNPILENCKIHPLEFLQTQVDVGFIIVNEENSDDRPPAGRNPTRNEPLMVLMRFILG